MPAPVAPPTRTALNRALLLSAKVLPVATLAANRTSITAGTQVRLTGKVALPALVSAAGLRVVLQERRGGTWTTVATTKLSTSGVATFLKSPQQTVHYRMRYEGSPLIAATNSSGVNVTVRSSTVKSSTTKSSTTNTAKATTASVGGTTATKLAKVLATAKAQTGDPYVFGAAGPNSFDCSGLTQYAYKSVGITLPHKANSQKSYGRGITRAQASPGDLIIFLDGGYGYHAAIYAGGGYMYDAPRAGSSVGKHKIWSTNIIFRRLV